MLYVTTASAVPVIVKVASCPEHIGPFVAEIVAVGNGFTRIVDVSIRTSEHEPSSINSKVNV